MIDAYIFDLDGTLSDTEALWVETTWRFVCAYDPAFSRQRAVDLVYGRSWLDIYHDLTASVPAMTALSLEEVETGMRSVFEALLETVDTRIPGSVELLRRLAARHPVAIVSGSPRLDIERAIDRLGIRNEISFSIAAEDCSAGKPDPEGFLKAARRLGVAPGRCVVFEDSRAGVLAAKRAGMLCVALKRPGAPAQDTREADLLLEDLAAFREESLPAPSSDVAQIKS